MIIKILKNQAISLEEKINDIKEQNEQVEETHKLEISNLNKNIKDLNEDIDNLNVQIIDIKDSYSSGNQNLSTKVRTGQSANYKFNWLEIDKLKRFRFSIFQNGPK